MALAEAAQAGPKEVSLVEEFSPEKLAEVDAILAAKRGRRGALIPVLKDVQDVTGYLPISLQRKIAEGLNLSFSEVFGVVSFYSFFSMKPKGAHQIKICMGTACYVRGNKDFIEALSRDLKCTVGGITEDRKFSLDAVRCLGCCGIAPVITVDEKPFRQVRAQQIPAILEQFP
ncbi:MAG: NAD(P)H-dependent oxidoreductase subunit E [bacterium]